MKPHSHFDTVTQGNKIIKQQKCREKEVLKMFWFLYYAYRFIWIHWWGIIIRIIHFSQNHFYSRNPFRIALHELVLFVCFYVWWYSERWLCTHKEKWSNKAKCSINQKTKCLDFTWKLLCGHDIFFGLCVWRYSSKFICCVLWLFLWCGRVLTATQILVNLQSC